MPYDFPSGNSYSNDGPLLNLKVRKLKLLVKEKMWIIESLIYAHFFSFLSISEADDIFSEANDRTPNIISVRKIDFDSSSSEVLG